LWHEYASTGRINQKLELSGDKLGKYQEFIDLVDYQKTLPLICKILGWNIQLSYFGLVVNPTQSLDKVPMRYHQDGGRLNFDVEIHPRPRFSVKIAYWLTDGSELGRGNFYVVPGSHFQDTLTWSVNGEPKGARPVFVKPGDAIVFDRRVWHTRKPNHSPHYRKVLFYDYAFRWLVPKCSIEVPPDLLSRCNPVKRQLLGIGISGWRSFAPRQYDSPLKVWMEKNGLLINY
jgi:ectoine hydroxylase-related dioxygenase (phytanoyl-CoA dioxygenase family)